jgi:hypothetical protein
MVQEVESRGPGDPPEVVITAKFGTLRLTGHARGRFHVSLAEECTVRGIPYLGGMLLECEETGWTVHRDDSLRRNRRWGDSSPDITWKQRESLRDLIAPVAIEFAGSPEGKKFLREAERAHLVRTINGHQTKIAELEAKLGTERAALHEAEEKLLAL